MPSKFYSQINYANLSEFRTHLPTEAKFFDSRVTSQSIMHAHSRFAPEEVIHSGTDSQLIRAYDRETGCKVIIKQAIRPASQVFTEIEFLSEISHQHAIRPIWYDKSEGTLVLPFAHGGDLFSVLESETVISEDAMRKSVYSILQCLECIHALGIVHNDIKPDNILVCDVDYTGENVILSDFGLADEYDKYGFCYSLGGTLEYSSPEKIDGYGYDGTADIWSLGVTMFSCLLGAWPFRDGYSATDEILGGLPILETSVMDRLSCDARGILLKMLEFNAYKRISASQALKDPWFAELVDCSTVL